MTEEYFVSIDYQNAPRKAHDSYESALTEAFRLSPLHPNQIIRVLKQVAVLSPRAEHELKEFK
jgi:hypothetical protein